jgi:hypothetical protein
LPQAVRPAWPVLQVALMPALREQVVQENRALQQRPQARQVSLCLQLERSPPEEWARIQQECEEQQSQEALAEAPPRQV